MRNIDGEALADRICGAIGSWRFTAIQGGLMLLWVLINSLAFLKVIHFDAYPFIFLNLAMSAEAAFAMPMMLMSGNRTQARMDGMLERIVTLEKTLDEHVNITAKQHTTEIRANTALTQEIHALVKEMHAKATQPRGGNGRFVKAVAGPDTPEITIKMMPVDNLLAASQERHE